MIIINNGFGKLTICVIRLHDNSLSRSPRQSGSIPARKFVWSVKIILKRADVILDAEVEIAVIECFRKQLSEYY